MDKIIAIKNKVRISEWSDMVRACHDRGLTVQQWCNSNGIQKRHPSLLMRQRQHQCLPEKEKVIQEAMKYFGMI